MLPWAALRSMLLAPHGCRPYAASKAGCRLDCGATGRVLYQYNKVHAQIIPELSKPLIIADFGWV